MTDLQFTLPILPSVLSGLISLLAAIRLYNHRSSPGAVPLSLLFYSIFILSLGLTGERLVPTLSQKVIWLQIQYLGTAFVSVFWLLFCLRYSNHKRPGPTTFFLIFSWIPIITIILAFTNQIHNLIWSGLHLSEVRGVTILQQDFGPWFWLNALYSHALYLAGIFLLIQFFFRTPRALRLQILLVILAGLIPGAANYLYLAGANPFPTISITSLSFILMGLIIVYVLYFHQFLNLIPIARDTTVENMRDGIVVVDLKDRIVDINPAAQNILQTSLKEVLGKTTSEVLDDLADWISRSKEGNTPVKILNIGRNEDKKNYVLNQITLNDARGSLIGYTIIFHDTTETHALNKSLKVQADRLAVLYEIGKAITSTLEIDDLLGLIFNQLSKVIHSDAYFVALYHPDSHQLEIKVLSDRGKLYPPSLVDADQGVSSWIVKHKKPLLVKDLSKELVDLGVKPIMVGDRKLSRSWLGVPLIADDQLIGLLAVTSYAAGVFDENDQLLMEQIGQQAALSIQNARHYEEASQQAKLDSLTGVSNHNHFIEKLHEEGEKALARMMPLSLIMLDIDYFKTYNDTYGHTIGDQVLRLTVQAISSHVKKTDIVGRWGGEEFGIILPNAAVTQANMVANRIRNTLSELPLFDVAGQTIPKPTISQGIATIPDHTTDVDELMVIADRALYRAKERGRDQVAVGIASSTQ